jgi:hypothetical protein
MAIQQAPGGAMRDDVSADERDLLDRMGVGSATITATMHEVQVPTFDKTDPAQPGAMSTTHVTTDPIVPFPQSPSSSSSSTPTKEKIMFFNSDKAAFNKFNNAPAATVEVKKPVDPIQAAQAKAKRSSAILSGLRAAGFVTGAGAIGSACVHGMRSAKAAEAAAAAAAEAGTVVVEGTVVAGETVASTGVVGTVMGTLRASKTIVGITLPVWGWVAAGAAVVAVSYVGYRMVKKDDAEAAPVAPATVEVKKPEEVGVTLPQAARAVGSGFVSGAVFAGALAGTGLLVGQVGSAVVAKSTVAFGEKYGLIVAIGGTYVAFNLLNSAITASQQAYAKRQAEKLAEAAMVSGAATAAA